MREPEGEGAAGLARLALSSARDASVLSRETGDAGCLAVRTAELLRERRPGSAVLLDEAATTSATARLVWVVGGLATGAVAVAAAVDGTVVAAAVLDLRRGSSFSASRGGGARDGGRLLRASAHVGLSGAAVARDATSTAALSICDVAAGTLDGYVGAAPVGAAGLAGAHIAEEAGAVVELPCPENGGVVLVAAPGVFEALRATAVPVVRS